MRGRGVALGVLATLVLQVVVPALLALGHDCGEAHVQVPSSVAAASHDCPCGHHDALRGNEILRRQRVAPQETVRGLDLHEECALCSALQVQMPPSFSASSEGTLHTKRIRTRIDAPPVFVIVGTRDHSHAARAPPLAS